MGVLRLPNAVGQTAFYHTTYISVIGGTALAGMVDVITEATNSGWGSGDIMDARLYTDEYNYILARVYWDSADSKLVIIDSERAEGAIADGTLVSLVIVPTEAALSPLAAVFDAAVFGLQGALDAAHAAGGGLVTVGPGVYLLTNTLLIYSNTTLRLHPNTIIRRNADINCLIRNATTGVIGYEGDSGITLEGGLWDGNKGVFTTNVCIAAFGHARNITIKDASFINAYGWHCLELNGVDTASVDGCRFSGLSAVDKELLQIDLMKSAAQYPWETSFDSTPCKQISITNCVFSDASRAIGTHSSSVGVSHQGILISGCTIHTMSQEGIYGYNWQDVTISNNYINNVLKGIVLTGADVATLSGFSIVGNVLGNMNGSDARGISILGVSGAVSLVGGVIAGNTIRQSGRHGIGVDYSASWTIANNVIRGVDRVPVWVFGSSKCVVSGNLIDTVGTYYTPKRGIHIGASSAPASATTGTIVTGNNTEAIITDYAANTIIENNVVTTTLTNGANATGTQTARNFVAGSWVA